MYSSVRSKVSYLSHSNLCIETIESQRKWNCGLSFDDFENSIFELVLSLCSPQLLNSSLLVFSLSTTLYTYHFGPIWPLILQQWFSLQGWCWCSLSHFLLFPNLVWRSLHEPKRLSPSTKAPTTRWLPRLRSHRSISRIFVVTSVVARCVVAILTQQARDATRRVVFQPPSPLRRRNHPAISVYGFRFDHEPKRGPIGGIVGAGTGDGFARCDF